MMPNRKHNLSLLGALTAMATVGLMIASGFGGAGSPQPANKMAVSGGSIDVLTAPLTSGSHSETHTILSGTIKTSAPEDLIFSVTLECALWTNVTTMGDQTSQSGAQVKVWVELDGTSVPVSADDKSDTGKVVFCDRLQKQTTLNFGQNETLTEYLKTREANAFNWITLNVGAATHTVDVKAQMTVQVSGAGSAQAGIGKRTLIVDPTKLAQDASI